jgi:hypothetical protein
MKSKDGPLVNGVRDTRSGSGDAGLNMKSLNKKLVKSNISKYVNLNIYVCIFIYVYIYIIYLYT